MEFIFFLFAIIFSQSAFGTLFSARIDFSVTNVSSSFAGANSAISLPGIRRIKSIQADNSRSSNELVLNCNTTPGVVPSNSSLSNIPIAPGETISTPDDIGGNTACYIRTFSGTASTGIFTIIVNGD